MTGPDMNRVGKSFDEGDDMRALERLRTANPVDLVGLPESDSPQARALFEEITMSTAPEPPVLKPMKPRRPRMLALAAAGATFTVAAVAAAALMLGGANEPAPIAVDDPGAAGGSMLMCVEIYSLETLAARQVAFDGTLTSIDGDMLTFEVNEAFRGVDGDTVTIGGGDVVAGDPALVGGPSLQVGDRALVAGDGEFAWGCGFTQAYDEAVATSWREALN
jgi:hypothetical protein